MKWQIKSPEEYIAKAREKVSVEEMRALFTGPIMIMIWKI